MTDARTDTRLGGTSLWKRILPAALAIAVGLSLSGALFYLARTWQQGQVKAEFEQLGRLYADQIQREADRREEIVNALEGLFAASEEVSREKFKVFAENTFEGHPEIRAIEWVFRIPHAKRRAFEAAAVRDGITDFEFTELGPDGSLVRAGQRPEYWIIYYSEPLARNRPAVGFDLASEPACREALEKAMATGEPTLSLPIKLVQGQGEDEIGHLLLQAHYRRGAVLDTLEDRQAAIVGYALEIINAPNMADHALTRLPDYPVDFWIMDQDREGRSVLLFHRLAGEVPDVSSPRELLWRTAITLGGRELTAEFRPTAAFYERKRYARAWLLLGGLLVLTAAIAYHLASAAARTASIERRAAQLARESMAHEQRYREVFEASNDAITLVAIGPDGQAGRFLDANAKASLHLGYSREELLEMTPLDVVTPETAAVLPARLAVLRARGSLIWDATSRTRTGAIVPVELSQRLLTLNGQNVVLTIARDMSERKRTETMLKDAAASLRGLLNATTEIMILTDPEMRVLNANNAAVQFFGKSPDGVLGRYCGDLLPADAWILCEESFNEALRSAKPLHTQRELHGKWFDVSLFPVIGEAGEVVKLAVYARDITEHKQAQDRLIESEQRFRELAANVDEVYWISDVSGRILYVSPAYEKTFGRDAAALDHDPLDWLKAIVNDDRDRVWRAFNAHHTTAGFQEEYRVIGERGAVRWIRDRTFKILNAHDALDRVARVSQDITEHKQAELERVGIQQMQMAKLSSALEQAADAVVITDREGMIEYVNPAFEVMTGFGRAEVVGMSSEILQRLSQDQDFFRGMWEVVRAGGVFRGVVINRRKDGTLYYEDKTVSPLKNETAEITHFIATGKDITERMQAEERLHHLAYHDVLTDLPNRALFMERLAHAVARRHTPGQRVAVMFLDLDRFKTINDTLGHAVGDRLLKAVPQRLATYLRGGDTLARFGGDEFAVMLEDVPSIDHVTSVAEKIVAAMAKPLVVDSQSLYITTSIGISLYPDDGQEVTALLKFADTAMYRAKELGRNTFQFYSAEMSALALERLTMESGLRQALATGGFVLHYQPQMELPSLKIAGFEALLRWRHPELGLLNPLRFVPLLEETGLIVSVGEWLLHAACHQGRQWQEQVGRPVRIAVNLSVRQLHDPGLLSMVDRALAESRMQPSALELEITESVLMQDDPLTRNNLTGLKQLGVALCIDDFGTGYSTLGNLRRLPLDAIKIDRSFVDDLARNPGDVAIIRAIIAMAQSLNLNVIAEGVETDQQLALLQSSGCTVVQGYLFSRPVTVERVDALLRSAAVV